jgi:ankyrin repeat protein
VRNIIVGLAAASLIGLTVPAAAQQGSLSYQFLEAVKKRKGDEVIKMLATPGTVLVNSKQLDGEGALHIVTRGRDLAWLEFLLSKGARPDIQTRTGDTPLMLAAQLGWVDGADALLKRRAAVDLANSRGETPLIQAVQKRDIAMVRLLLSRGANPKRTDSVAGYSALDYARQDSRAATIARTLEEAATKPARPLQGPKL